MTSLHKGYSHSPVKNKILSIVEDTIKAHRMFEPKDSVLIGVSGGSDSVALLHVLLELATKLSLTLGIAHLNHGIRHEDSDRDAEFVESLAIKLDLPCYIKKEDVIKYKSIHKLSMEEAARRVRYNFFNSIAEKEMFNKIALGHQGDDNAELVLMYMLRGSGPLGISGIPPVRRNIGRYPAIVRPLIRLKKYEIMNYLTASRLKYVTDRSNEDTKFLRNKVRHELIPILKQSYNKRITETLNRLASIMRSEEELIENIINPFYKDIVLNAKENCITLSVPELVQTGMGLKRRIIRRAIEKIKGDLRRITFSHIGFVIKLVEIGPAYGHLDLPDRIKIVRKGDILRISSGKKGGAENAEKLLFEHIVSQPGLKPEILHIKETGSQLIFSQTDIENITDIYNAGQRVAFFDMDFLSFPLFVRNFRPGDRFTPFGMGGSQKVKKYFINNKIDRTQRLKCPILISRDKIIWVAGHRQDEYSKVTSSTRNALKVELLLA